MGTPILWILSVVGLTTLAVSRHEIGRAWSRGNRLQAFAALVLVFGGMLSQADFVANPALLRQITTVLSIFLLLVILVATTGVVTSSEARFWVWPVLWAFILWLWLFVTNAYFTYAESPSAVILRAASGLLLLAFLFVQTRAPLRAFHFTSAALVALSVLLVFLPFMSRPLGSCTLFKCSEIGVVLLGPFPSGNFLGLQFAALAGLVIATVSSGRLLLFLLVVIVVGLYATNARTSLLAVGMGLVAWVLANWVFRARGTANASHQRHPVLAAVVGVGGPLVGLWLIYTATADSFSRRGTIWMLGVEAVGENALTGIGLDSWNILQAVGDVSYHFAHSQYMAVFFSGGIIGIVLLGVWLTASAGASMYGRSSPGRGVALPVIFAVAGLLEVVWNPLTVDGLTWIALATCCGLMQNSSARPSRGDVDPTARPLARAII